MFHVKHKKRLNFVKKYGIIKAAKLKNKKFGGEFYGKAKDNV